jgi:hypothetical protein
VSQRFDGSAGAIPKAIREEMRGRSWRRDPRCPPIEDLALLTVDHWGFDGSVHRGEMIVASAVADELLVAFARIFEARFPIETMQRIDLFDADDEASMEANNASSFCFRTAPSGRLSEHAFGLAVDINPVQNPMVIGGDVWPAAGRDYLNRDNVRPGMIARPGPVVDAFDAIGWEWGGDWTSLKDYHHFQRRRRAI